MRRVRTADPVVVVLRGRRSRVVALAMHEAPAPVRRLLVIVFLGAITCGVVSSHDGLILGFVAGIVAMMFVATLWDLVNR